ncbi:MAG: PA2779 family protein [Desulfuromusa sp.]|nr:PA2779 family protein [Desulfuromusa sp.]
MNTFRRTLALFLSVSLLCVSLGQAAIIDNNQVIHQIEQANDKAVLLQTINRIDVQENLLNMGVNSADLENRINQMTQSEIAQLNQQIDGLPAGAGVLGVVVLILVVFVITDVIGATNIFPFIHSIN